MKSAAVSPLCLREFLARNSNSSSELYATEYKFSQLKLVARGLLLHARQKSCGLLGHIMQKEAASGRGRSHNLLMHTLTPSNDPRISDEMAVSSGDLF